MDVNGLKTAARGRWNDILATAGIGSEFLTGKHGPCPKCGGTDRFRAADIDHGWLFCNQCHHAESGDGLASLQWWLQIDFKAACEFAAKQIGFVDDGAKSKRKPFNERVENHGPINEDLAAFFASNNPGVTLLGLERMGAFNGTHSAQPVACFPCFGEDLKTQNNYVVMSLFSREVQLVDKTGKPTGSVRKKTLDKGAGLIGAKSLELMTQPGLVDVAWKTEGPTDLAALLSIIPEDKFACGEHVAVCNLHGAGEQPGWMATKLAESAKVVHIVHDADRPGQVGAAKWADAIARAGGTVKIVQLPYDVAETHGKDLRDYIQESGGTAFGRLLSLAMDASTEAATPAGDTPDFLKEEVQMVLDRLSIDVLAELETGQILVYSGGTKKLTKIRSIDKLQRPGMVQACGYAAMNAIADAGESGKDKLSMNDVRTAIAVAASRRRMKGSDFELNGPGVWSTDSELVLCNGSHLSIWDGSTFTRADTPRVGGMVFELGRFDWYSHQRIEELITRAQDTEWCGGQWTRLIDLFDRWTWSRQATAPSLLAALTASTICQTIWRWRPQIAITGASNAGKTSLYEFLFGSAGGLAGLFGPLAMPLALSSEAGIRQTIGRTSYAVAIDEWDSLRSSRQREILNLLRTAGPASTIRLGTTHHHAMEFGLRHVVWLAGVHCGMDSETDENRFLWFEAIKPSPTRWSAWRSPTLRDRVELFESLVAMSIAHGLQARMVAADAFKACDVPGVHQRTIEGLAVPASLLAVSLGGGVTETVKLIERWAADIKRDDIDYELEEHRLMDEILGLCVDKGGMQKVAVASVIHSADYVDSEYRRQLESQLNIGIVFNGDLKYLAIRTGKVAKSIGLENAKSLTQVLGRLPGALQQRATIAGARHRCVLIPWSIIEWHCNDADSRPDLDT